jgi:hypothetical protein
VTEGGVVDGGRKTISRELENSSRSFIIDNLIASIQKLKNERSLAFSFFIDKANAFSPPRRGGAER